VYKACHLALKRTVALKMILAADHAGEQQRLRFKTEAEAVARLQHANIVQVFEVGEHQGLPFCALEFVEGGSLDKKLRDQPLPPRQAAQLVATLADAMHLAHSRNVVHRDLKPANILLTADGVPKVTDFGLARQLDSDSERTRPGAVMGTPSYMAPEQASGQTHDVGPAADVYGLGAILYACLTGRPPFQGANVLETLDQVRQQEPVAPRLWQPKVPRDLETICLKCLRKQPEQRYSSARELGDDLGRFLRDEPVTARPVGRLEKVAKWARRNPVVAASLTVVVLVLIVATAVSLSFWAAAVDRAKQLEKANSELTKQRDDLLTGMAEGMTQSLAENPGPLTDAEIEALWKPAERPDVPLGVRFVEVSLRKPVMTRQLKNRAEWALHAAVGLDPNKRAQVEQMLVRRLEAREVTPEQRLDIALTLCRFGGQSPATAGKAAKVLAQATSETNDGKALCSLAKDLSAVVARVDSREVPAIFGRVAAALARAISRRAVGEDVPAEPDTLTLAQGLRAMTNRLQPRDATASLAQAMSETTDSGALQALAKELSAVAARLAPGEGGEAASILARAISKEMGEIRLQYLAQGLSVLAARPDPQEAGEAAASLVRAMTRTTQPDTVVLIEELESWAEGLVALAPRLEPRAAGEAANTLVRLMAETKEPDKLPPLSEGLAAVAARLESGEAAAVCGRAAAILAQAMSEKTDLVAVRLLAARLEPKEAANRIVDAISKTTDGEALHWLANGLVAVAARLEPKEAANRIVDAISKTTHPFALEYLARELAAAAARLEPKEARATCDRAATILARAISRETGGEALLLLAHGLSAVAAHLDPREAGESAAALTQAISQTPDPGALQHLAEALSAVAAHLDPKQAGEIAATLSQAITRTRDSKVARSLARELVAVAARLDPGEAAAVCLRAATMLALAVSNTTNPGALPPLAFGLSAVAARLEPREAAAVCGPAATRLARVMSEANNPRWLEDLAAPALSAVAAHLAPREAGEIATILVRAMSKATDSQVLYYLAQGLSAVVARMELKEAREVAATLNQAMSEKRDPFALQGLAQGLSAAAARLEPREAASICRRAATLLTQAMSKTTDPLALSFLAGGLSAVAVRLDPGEATAVCGWAATLLVQATPKATDLVTGQFDAGVVRFGLEAVLSAVEPAEQQRRAIATVGAVGMQTSSLAALGRWPLLQPALQPPPYLLADSQLVELLKHPFCVGAARRVVLDQLGNRHNRRFEDQWDFVRFAQEQNLGLDLTTPPQRLAPPTDGR
jgi:hypothetical protein